MSLWCKVFCDISVLADPTKFIVKTTMKVNTKCTMVEVVQPVNPRAKFANHSIETSFRPLFIKQIKFDIERVYRNKFAFPLPPPLR